MLSVSTERQKELDTLQEVITSLTLRLRERNNQFKTLKQNLKGNSLVTSHYMSLLLDLAFRSNNNKAVTDQGLQKTQKLSSQEKTSLISETIGSNKRQ